MTLSYAYEDELDGCPLGSYEMYGTAVSDLEVDSQPKWVFVAEWFEMVHDSGENSFEEARTQVRGLADSGSLVQLVDQNRWSPDTHYGEQLRRVPPEVRDAIVAVAGMFEFVPDEDEPDILDDLLGG